MRSRGTDSNASFRGSRFDKKKKKNLSYSIDMEEQNCFGFWSDNQILLDQLSALFCCKKSHSSLSLVVHRKGLNPICLWG